MTAVAEAPQRVGRGAGHTAGASGDESVDALSFAGVPDVWDQVALLKRVAAPGGFRGATGDQALLVIEAAEAVKAWAESGAVMAAAHLTRELESDRLLQDPCDRTRLGRQRFVRECRSVAAREI